LKVKNIKERKMLAKEWAVEDRIDPMLFNWWTTLMTKAEYEKIKIKVYRPRGEI